MSVKKYFNQYSKQTKCMLLSIFLCPALFVSVAHAKITTSGINQYAQSMKTAANAKRIDDVSNLILDSALIKFTRKNKNSTLSKDGYLKLLQNRWASSENYNYSIHISNVVITGNQAITDVKTIERFSKNGKSVEYISKSKATLVQKGDKVLLSKFKSNISIN